MILVTGGTGLVGSHLLFELAQRNEEVRVIVRNRQKIKLVEKVFSYYSEDYKELVEKIQWVNGDLFDLSSLSEAFVGVNKVYHCAAIVSIGGKNPDQLINENVGLTENMVNLCLENKIEKLCHVSSIATMGNSVNGELITEGTTWTSSKNRSAYSVSKFKSEMEVWRGVEEGLNAVIVNPSVILGPGFWNSGSGALFTKAAKGMKYYTQGITGFVDVRDVVRSMIKLMESDICSERFILNSENISYKQLFDMVAEAMQVNKPKKEASKSLLKLAVGLDSVASSLKIKKQEITKDVIRASTSITKYSNQKILESIGIDFIPVETSIKKIAQLFKEDIIKN